MLNSVLLCCFAQIVSFDGPEGYARIGGQPDQVIRFYDEWSEYVWPERCNANELKWFQKQRDRVVRDARNGNGDLLFTTDRHTRMGLFQAIMFRGYNVRFRATVHPFGSFWIYYNSIAHAVICIVALGCCVWFLRRKRASRGK